jgi:hypothetical protein
VGAAATTPPAGTTTGIVPGGCGERTGAATAGSRRGAGTGATTLDTPAAPAAGESGAVRVTLPSPAAALWEQLAVLLLPRLYACLDRDSVARCGHVL